MREIKKIDPNFYIAIKTYVSFLERIEHLPNEGQFSLIDELQNTALKEANWYTEYLNDISVGQLLEKEIMISDEVFSSLSKFPKNNVELASYLEICSIVAEKLTPSSSAEFYIERIKDITSTLSDFNKNMEKPYRLLIIPLWIRYLFMKLDEINEEINEKEIESVKSNGLLNLLIASIHEQMSLICNKQTISELLKQGDDKSFLKALTIDKNLLNSEPIKKRITKAQVSGDTEFLEKLSKAISKRPLTSIKQHGKTYAVLKFFWPVLYPLLTAEEIHDLLRASGLVPPPFPDGFYKFIQRHINPAFTPNTP